jgi:penicillin-binding protein 2
MITIPPTVRRQSRGQEFGSVFTAYSAVSGKYLKNADKEWYRQRLTRSMFCIMAAFTLLIARLFYLQIVEGEEYRRLSESNCIRLRSIDAPRGLIFDCNGNLLADNRPSFDLSIIVKDAENLEDTLEKLSQYTGISSELFKARIKAGKGLPSYKPIILEEDIGREMLAVIEVHKFDLPGVSVDVRLRRQYIHRESAAHITGYLGEVSPEELKSGKYEGCRVGDFIGKFGIEKSAEFFLRGTRGGQQVEVNARGQVVRVLKTVDAFSGHNIYLTIDQALQRKAESLIEGIAAAVVAMNPDTGDILAMASSPSFDPNSFVNGLSGKEWRSLINNPLRPMENKAIQGEYPPASTYKIVTAIAGLEEGVIDENTSVFCPGHYEYGDRTFRCWKKTGHGSVNVVKALAESCDVFFYQVGQKLGVDRLARYAKACGLGTPTGVMLDHEGGGLIPTSAWKKHALGVPWQGGETLSVAIGQGYNLATPLQMAMLTAAVANGGTLYRPRILKAVETAEGSTAYQDDPALKPQAVGKLPCSKKTLELIRKGLWEVVNGQRGTARIARADGVKISGKTGTAQVISRKGNDSRRKKEDIHHHKPHAWFVAYAESKKGSKNSRIAVSVIVEHGEHGSGTAAPIARDLIKYFMGIEDPELQPERVAGNLQTVYQENAHGE